MKLYPHQVFQGPVVLDPPRQCHGKFRRLRQNPWKILGSPSHRQLELAPAGLIKSLWKPHCFIWPAKKNWRFWGGKLPRGVPTWRMGSQLDGHSWLKIWNKWVILTAETNLGWSSKHRKNPSRILISLHTDLQQEIQLYNAIISLCFLMKQNSNRDE